MCMPGGEPMDKLSFKPKTRNRQKMRDAAEFIENVKRDNATLRAESQRMAKELLDSEIKRVAAESQVEALKKERDRAMAHYQTFRTRAEAAEKERALTPGNGSVDFADCGHNRYWTTHYGNCMACRAEAAESESTRLEAEVDGLRARVELAVARAINAEEAIAARDAELTRLRERWALYQRQRHCD